MNDSSLARNVAHLALAGVHVARCTPIVVPEYVGSRWTPKHALRINTDTGAFEEVNPLARPGGATTTELNTQRALLRKVPK